MLNSLRQHQSGFSCALIDHQGDHKGFLQKVTKKSKIPPQLALDIYRNNTLGARLKALTTIYPVCGNILGDEIFHLIGQQYVTEDNEGSSDLNYYGESFSLHLKSLLEAGRLPEEYCYLTDLASLEYKIHIAYYASADPVFSFKRFEQMVNTMQQVYFKASPSLSLMASEYPVYEIWRSNKDPQYVGGIRPIDGMQYLLVYRNNYRSSVVVISEDEYSIIKCITNNVSLQDIISNTNCDVNDIVPVLIANKWIVDIN